MAIGGKNISVSSNTSTPGSLNAWLREHGGYDGENDLIEAAVPGVNPAHIQWTEAFGMHRTNDISLPQIIKYLRAGV